MPSPAICPGKHVLQPPATHTYIYIYIQTCRYMHTPAHQHRPPNPLTSLPACLHACIHTDIHTYIPHTYLANSKRRITMHCNTLQYMISRNVTLHCITFLPCFTSHCIALHCIALVHTPLQYITSQSSTIHFAFMSHCLHYINYAQYAHHTHYMDYMQCIALHSFHYIALH